jgi:hypothetical protein
MAVLTRINHTLKVLQAIKSLLLLEQESIRDQGQAANGFTVCRIRERNPLVVSEIQGIIFSFTAGIMPTDLGSNCGRSFVSVLEV